MAKDTLTITDNRTGKQYEIPIEHGAIRAIDLRQIKTDADDFGLMTYDPAFTNTASCKSRITYIDGDKGILRYRGYPIEELAEKSNYLETAYLIVKGELPEPAALRDVEAQHHDPHDGPRERQEVHGRLPLRRAPDGHAGRHDRRALDLLSRRQEHLRPRVAPPADPPPDRQDADARGLRVPPQPRPALRLSGQRALLHRQLPVDALQDDRARLQAEPGARARARRAVHPARRPRAELLDQRRAQRRQLARRSVLGGRGGGRRALRPAARRRQRGGHPHAEGDRLGRQGPGGDQEVEGGRGPPDGLRPPRLQELRSARQDHQARSPTRSSR